MEKSRNCGCKGIRTCLLCELEFGLYEKSFSTIENNKLPYVFCPWCDRAWPGSDVNSYTEHPNHNGDALDFPGIFIQMDFLSLAEEEELIKGIDEMTWDTSQSGRRKQNFGPKCNFKKKRLKLGDFKGFPSFTKFIQDKFENVDILKGYQTVEQCSLEYNPERGASIDPHIDDCWVWGERIITVNLLADSTLTMTHYQGEPWRYNLPDVRTYPSVLDEFGKLTNINSDSIDLVPNMNCYVRDSPANEQFKNCVVRIPMPRRSLLVMYGPARYLWEHSVLRQDILNRRVCLAYREFTPLYLKNGKHEDEGRVILEMAKNFWDHKQ